MLTALKNVDKIKLGTFLLFILAFIELTLVARHPYVMDFIGRALLTSAVELARGQAIYTTPDSHSILSMAYTPGFVLLEAAFFSLFGLSRVSWNGVWIAGSVFYIVFFTTYFLKKRPAFALLIPASVLACLFPFLWARADMWALVFIGLGALCLQFGRIISLKLFISASLFFALALFFKQTMAPMALGLLLVKTFEDRVDFSSAIRFLSVSSLMGGCFLFLMGGYVFLWDESLKSMRQVMTLGASHQIPFMSMLRASFGYSLLFGSFAWTVWHRHTRSIFALTVLFLAGIPYVFFAAKEGGGVYHFLVFIVPWLLYANEKLPQQPKLYQKTLIYPWLALAFFAYIFLPLRPSEALPTDKEAVQELEFMTTFLPIKGSRILLIDSLSGFVFPDPLYAAGGLPTYERAALEEFKKIPHEMLSDIEKGSLDYVFIRKGDLYGVTAYGVAYAPLYDVIEKNMRPCLLRDNGDARYWRVLCAKK